MRINNNFQNTNFKGFKDFIYDADLSDNETNFVQYLKENTEYFLDNKNGKKSLYETDNFIPAEEIQQYDLIDVYGDVYRDEKNKNEVFLKLRIKPTIEAIDRIKDNALDEKAKEELQKNPLITEYVSQPIAVRSKNAASQVIRNLEEKISFFKRYILGTVKWKTSTKDLLKSTDKPKFGWDRDLIDDFNRAVSIGKMTKAINSALGLK